MERRQLNEAERQRLMDRHLDRLERLLIRCDEAYKAERKARRAAERQRRKEEERQTGLKPDECG